MGQLSQQVETEMLRRVERVRLLCDVIGESSDVRALELLNNPPVKMLVDALIKTQKDAETGRQDEEQRDLMWKKRVAAKAWEYAERYNWCKEVQEALAELDIQLFEPRLEATIQVTYQVHGKVGYDHLPSMQEGGAEWVRAHIGIPSAILSEPDAGMSLDGTKHQDGVVDPASILVIDWVLRAPEVIE